MVHLTAAHAPDVSRVVVSGPSNITVSWNVPDVNTSYVVYYHLLQGEEDNETVSSSAGELTIDGLQPGGLYTVRVLALSQHLPSQLSGPTEIKVAGEMSPPHIQQCMHTVANFSAPHSPWGSHCDSG